VTEAKREWIQADNYRMATTPYAHSAVSPPEVGDERERVLLVEDSLFQARLLEEMLRTLDVDIRVEHTATLTDARAVLEDGGPRVSCIVLDLTLPDSSGLEGVSAMCSAAPETPLVVVTATDDEALAIEAVRLGAQDYLIKGQIDPQLLRRSIRYAVERKRGGLLLAHQAEHDPLTGLPNRVRFAERLTLALATSEREATLVAVHFCDLNGFKGVNDSLGHAAGDHLLQIVARRLESAIRPADMVARHGGDEFTAVTGQVDGVKYAVAIADRIRKAISEPIMLTGREIRISTSVGIALASGTRHDAEDVIAAADNAMYRAKSSGTSHEVVWL
jgi:two-component system, cell cycle response regulator